MSAYRNDDEVVHARLAELRRQKRQELEALPQSLFRLYVTRVRRSWVGATLILGMCLTILSCVWSVFLPDRDGVVRSSGLWEAILSGQDGVVPGSGYWFVGAWGGALLAALIAWMVSGQMARRGLTSQLLLEDLPAQAALPLLEEQSARQLLNERLQALARRSYALPMIGFSLVGPLTLHLVVYVLLKLDYASLASFGEWIALSFLIVGHCHLLLAYFAWRFTTRMIAGEAVGEGWSYYGWVVLASAVPGIILFAVPVMLVALTGLCIIPVMFGWARKSYTAEQALLQTA